MSILISNTIIGNQQLLLVLVGWCSNFHSILAETFKTGRLATDQADNENHKLPETASSKQDCIELVGWPISTASWMDTNWPARHNRYVNIPSSDNDHWPLCSLSLSCCLPLDYYYLRISSKSINSHLDFTADDSTGQLTNSEDLASKPACDDWPACWLTFAAPADLSSNRRLGRG